jgi:hypothetical protein
VIVEEAIESSISNIEMSKSEKSLQKPLQLALQRIPLKDPLKEPLRDNLMSVQKLSRVKLGLRSESYHEQSLSTNSHAALDQPLDESGSNIDNISD